ncbi:Nucleic acid-binding protein [Corchorus olitorius]|uniref:Nucleic acid-binding protein n=1 Tax=Corchorus olitorius TaxID=93759 RepID=A0A1R3KLI3_9ROSI|nr:Nucleic acid-binding protein [Corchorus olitorius]
MDNGQAIFQGELSTLRFGGQPNSVVVRLIRIWDCIIPPLNMFVGIDFLVVDSQVGFGMHGCIPLDAADICRSWYLTDVLGLLEAITDVTECTLPNNKGIVFKRDIYLTLLTLDHIPYICNCGERVIVRLWNPKVDDLDVTSIALLGYKPLLAIAGLHIKQYQGCKCINSCSTTRIYVDPNIQETIQARERSLLDGSMVEFISGDLTDIGHKFSFHDAQRRTVEQLLYTNPAAIKGLKFRVLAKIVQLDLKAGWYYYSCQQCSLGLKRLNNADHCRIYGLTVPRRNLRLSLILEHAGFKLRVVVFGTLAHRLTGLDATMLHFAQKINWKVIPVDTTSIINMEYDFVLGVLKRSTGCGMAFKIYQFATIATGARLPS